MKFHIFLLKYVYSVLDLSPIRTARRNRNNQLFQQRKVSDYSSQTVGSIHSTFNCKMNLYIYKRRTKQFLIMANIDEFQKD